MNRTSILLGSAVLGTVLSQGVLAGGWMTHHPPAWGPYGSYGYAWKPYRPNHPVPHHRAPWMRHGHGPGAPHWMPRHGVHPAAPMARPGYAAGPGAAAQAAAPAARDQSPALAVAAADSARVAISQMRYGPARATVKKGGTVTWTQGDGMPHTVTAVDGSFDSGRLAAGGEFSQTFDTAGTFAYYCTLHPSMRGEVVVVD